MDLESLRLGLLKVKPSLRNSIFKCGQLGLVMSVFPSVWPGHVKICLVKFCLVWVCRNLQEYFDHLLSQQLSYYSHRTSYNSHKLSYAVKHCSSLNSHTSPKFIVVTLSHSPSHSHTISAVHLHILMSGKGLITL